MKRQNAVLLSAALLSACASAPPLSDTGSRVRIVTPDQVRACKFIRVVQYTDRIMGMGKNATIMKAIGETNLQNLVGETGGNALVITKRDAEWFLGNIAYQGEAYSC